MREFYQKHFRRSETCALVDEDRTARGFNHRQSRGGFLIQICKYNACRGLREAYSSFLNWVDWLVYQTLVGIFQPATSPRGADPNTPALTDDLSLSAQK